MSYLKFLFMVCLSPSVLWWKKNSVMIASSRERVAAGGVWLAGCRTGRLKSPTPVEAHRVCAITLQVRFHRALLAEINFKSLLTLHTGATGAGDPVVNRGVLPTVLEITAYRHGVESATPPTSLKSIKSDGTLDSFGRHGPAELSQGYGDVSRENVLQVDE